MQIPYCPVLTPTWKEFRNFEKFVEKVDRQYKATHGMVKVRNLPTAPRDVFLQLAR